MDQVAQGTERVVDVGLGRWTVDLIEVDVVGPEPLEAVLALGDDPPARVPLGIGIARHGSVHFGGQNDVVAVEALERLADDDL